MSISKNGERMIKKKKGKKLKESNVGIFKVKSKLYPIKNWIIEGDTNPTWVEMAIVIQSMKKKMF